jgi:mannobiose 2-epimerase
MGLLQATMVAKVRQLLPSALRRCLASGAIRRRLGCKAASPPPGLACDRGVAPHAGLPQLQEQRATLENLLVRNILEWWYPRTLDHTYGGYLLNHDADGRYAGPHNKALVSQARLVWFLARVSRTQYGGPEHLEGARHGFAFLRDHMWDTEYGGFYWEVNPKGTRATKREKHLYGQAFGLCAVSEYALASGDDHARDLARRLFDLIDYQAHDSRFGGYRELFERDWSNSETTFNPMESRVSPNTKLANTHLHLLEAVTAYYAMSHAPVARERLLELISIQSVAILRPHAAAYTDKFAADWAPLPGYDRVSYGHNVENASLLIEACEAAGISAGPFRGLLESIFDTSLKYGFDTKEGGFYDSGPLGAPADTLTKISWVQAEGLMAALHMYRLTSNDKYLACFNRTLDWILRRQVDWEHGDWHQSVSPEGKILGNKAGPWGGPYHHGRAMIVCLELLNRMGR